MSNLQNTISPDYQDLLAEQFTHINFLINNNKIDSAIEHLLELHYADLADFLDNTNHKLYQDILIPISNKINPETLACLSDSNKQAAIEAIGIEKSSKIINNLDIETAIETIEILDEELKKSIISKLQHSKQQQIIEGFKYPENSAGRILEKDFVTFSESWTASEAIKYIKNSNIKTDFHAAIIVNSKSKPVGIIMLSALLKAPDNTHIKELMNQDFKIADTYTELDELAFIFKQYALTIVPVTNKQGRLVGSISIDNMIYIIEEQTENEFMNLGGINNSDIFYNLYETSKYRFPWLFVNLVTACLTSMVIEQFSSTIAKLVTLATMMPIVCSMGGNAGTQAMTVTVRALINREINSTNTFRVILKEIFVCTINGFLLALIGAGLTYLLFDDLKLSMIFAFAVSISFVLSGFLGSTIPIMLNRIHIDPATASSVLLTACTDAIGFFTFLGLAYFFFG